MRCLTSPRETLLGLSNQKHTNLPADAQKTLRELGFGGVVPRVDRLNAVRVNHDLLFLGVMRDIPFTSIRCLRRHSQIRPTTADKKSW